MCARCRTTTNTSACTRCLGSHTHLIQLLPPCSGARAVMRSRHDGRHPHTQNRKRCVVTTARARVCLFGVTVATALHCRAQLGWSSCHHAWPSLRALSSCIWFRFESNCPLTTSYAPPSGADKFISVTGTFLPTCMGLSLVPNTCPSLASSDGLTAVPHSHKPVLALPSSAFAMRFLPSPPQLNRDMLVSYPGLLGH